MTQRSPLSLIPRITCLLKELNSRSRHFYSAYQYSLKLQNYMLHFGKINYSLVINQKKFSLELVNWDTDKITTETDQLLACTQTSLVGLSPDDYSLITEIRNLLKKANESKYTNTCRKH